MSGSFPIRNVSLLSSAARGLLVAAAWCALALGAIACGDDDEGAPPTADATDTGEGQPGADVEPGEPDASAPDADPTPDGEGPGEGDAGEGDAEGGGAPPCPEAAGCTVTLCPGPEAQEQLQTAFIEAQPHDVLCLAAGTFALSAELSIAVDDVTIRGAGMQETILDFSGQVVGANGMRINGDRVTVEDFQVSEPKGDGVRAQGVEGVAFRRLYVIWATPGAETNGAYGLYPVLSSDILVQDSVVVGASDAGIYVGQSQRAIVENCEVYGNVAGIEIENTTDAEVRGNYCHDNTGGVLVFNLPGLPVTDGKRAKVHDNLIVNNNTPNFAPEGNIVGKVPTGTGVLILASDDNEVYDNVITGNDSVGVAIVSFEEFIFGKIEDETFDKFPTGNYVHGNVLGDNGGDRDGIVMQIPWAGESFPDLAWDGCEPKGADPFSPNCFWENGDATFVNFDLCNVFANMSSDLGDSECEGTPLPTLELEWWPAER